MRQGNKKRRREKFLIWLVTAVLFIVLVVGGIFIFWAELGNKAESSEENAGENVSGDKDAEEQRNADGEGKNNTVKAEKEPELTEEEKLELEIDEILKNMPLEDKVSQLFFVRPEALTGVETAVQAGEMTRAALADYPVGGVVLFSENIENEGQLREMLANLQSYSKYPLFLGVDEEGGPLVARIANSGTILVPSFPNMSEIGNTRDAEKAYEVGTTIGEYLHSLGFNVDFAPVADVLTNSQNQVIGARAFGSDAALVSQMVAREVEGFEEQNVSAVLKHFPGHGGTGEDSHAEAAVLNRTKEELQSAEFLPFQAGIKAGADMVMVGHISVPLVTGDYTPATLSKQIVSEILRQEMGYDGIVITDSMSMGAIVNYYDPAEAAVMVLQAGGDMILMPQDFQASRQAVLDAVNAQALSEERIDESLKRIYRVKLKNISY